MSSAYLPPQSQLSNDEDEPILATLVEAAPSAITRRSTAIPNEPARSVLERFVDSFFRQENIRWLAVIGAAIVVASSLMIVTNEWSGWPVQAKFLTILAYTGLTYLFSDFGRKHLGLQITARVLQYLTLLLLPICFLSLSWLFGPNSAYSSAGGIQMLVLSVPALGLAWFSASRIFEYLWRGKQQTFLISYLTLCVAGAMPRLHEMWQVTLLTFALWLVATIGAIKINRHVFWMTEEHRLPRAFGFLPIALLGVQFLALVVNKSGVMPPIEWIGFGMVLMSSTVLLTTRAVADVHRQRTGGNMRPLPWNILAPLVVGIGMSLFGVALSFYGFSYVSQTTYAVVPSALLAGLMMFQATRETNQRAFVWIGLVLMAISYQCAPTLFAGLVATVKANAAYAVGEDRLPLAFYGLSYLPFLLIVAGASSLLARRNANSFAVPMRQFVTVLSLAFCVLSWTHIKACFPVAVVNLLMFGLFAMIFRDRRYAIPAMAALTVAVGTWIPFVNAMQLADLPLINIVTSLSVYAGILAAFPQLDRLINRLPLASDLWRSEFSDRDGKALPVCHLVSCIVTINMAAIWLLWVISSVSVSYSNANIGTLANFAYSLGMIPLAALVVNSALLTVRTRSIYYSLGMWSLMAVAAVASAFYLRVPVLEIASGTTIVCAVVSFVSLLPLRGSAGLSSATYMSQFSRLSENGEPISLFKAFVFPLHLVSTLILLSLIVAVHVPTVLVTNVSLIPLFAPLGTVAVLGWLVATKLAYKSHSVGIATAVAFPLLCSAVAISAPAFAVPGIAITYATLPLIWSVAAVATRLAAFRSVPQSPLSVQSVALTWVVVSAALSLSSFELVARITAIVSLSSLAVMERHRYGKQSWTALAIAANIQILMLVAGLSGMTSWFDLLQNPNLGMRTLPALAAILAASVAVWDIRSLAFDSKLRHASQIVLRTSCAAAIVACFAITSAEASQTIMVLASLAIAATAEFIEAVRKQRTTNLWACFALTSTALVWLISQGQLHVGSGASQIIMVVASVATLLISRLARDHRTFGFASPPLDQIGLTCPAMLVGLTVCRNLLGSELLLPGVDSAMLLAAAAIYFHRGLTTSNRAFVIAAAVVFNIASVQLWWSLSLRDLQLYLVPLGLTIIGMVQLLKKEIPSSAHNPIRNLGALVILVSPVFEIFGGSWLHLITLLVLSVLVILLSIGLHIRTLVYVGTAFLFADLVAMVIQSAIANPGLLWIGGLGMGIAVIALAAVCENHREQLLSKIRILSAELATWN
jgi:hypothetical protein